MRERSMKPLLIRFGILTLVLGWAVCGFAASEHIGIVKTVSGDVVIERNGQSIAAQINTKVINGDLVKTGSDGKVGLVFADDTVISMGSNSQIVIEDFLFEPAEKELSFVARMIQGTASFLSGQIAKLAPETVRLETPDATIGLRGTRVLVKVQ
jgi:hypothetical protein